VTAASVDLNADLGEGGPADRALLDLVTSASVACGFHAGGPRLMLDTADEAARRGVAVGAHPSYDDREGFGRRALSVTPDDLYAELAYQIGAMSGAASAAGTRVTYIKAHGALYNRAAVDPATAEVVVRAAAAFGLPLLCPSGSEMAATAAVGGVHAYCEVFADRAYTPEGTLVPRSSPGAVLADEDEVVARSLRLVLEGTVVTVDGREVAVAADSICIHGDTPGAVALARRVRRELAAAGVALRPFSAA